MQGDLPYDRRRARLSDRHVLTADRERRRPRHGRRRALSPAQRLPLPVIPQHPPNAAGIQVTTPDGTTFDPMLASTSYDVTDRTTGKPVLGDVVHLTLFSAEITSDGQTFHLPAGHHLMQSSKEWQIAKPGDANI